MEFIFKPRLAVAALYGECVEERVQAALRPFDTHVARVTVNLTEVHIQGGEGVGQGSRQCRIEIRSHMAGKITVSVCADDWRSAFDEALVKASMDLERRIRRSRLAFRQTSPVYGKKPALKPAFA